MSEKKEKNPLIRSGSVSLSAIGHVETKGLAKWKKPKLPGKKKSAYEYLRGHEKSKSANTLVFKTRKIDRENDEYFEEVLDHKTDETIRFCAEPLSRHMGRGSAKHKNTTRSMFRCRSTSPSENMRIKESIMFGFGKSYDDEYLELYEHLTQQRGMKPDYAESFLNAYKKSIGKMFVQGKKRLEGLEIVSDAERKIMRELNPGYECDLVLVEQAYAAYFRDLRRGKHVGTQIEKAIWAILYTKLDLVLSFDKAFANYIQENQEEKFPGLFEEVFQL